VKAAGSGVGTAVGVAVATGSVEALGAAGALGVGVVVPAASGDVAHADRTSNDALPKTTNALLTVQS